MEPHRRPGRGERQHPGAGRPDPALIDAGSTSLSIVLLTPVFVAVAFAAFQAALWTNARTQVRAAARDAAVLVARFGAEPDDVVVSTTDLLEDRSAITNVLVRIPHEPIATEDTVVVTITADAPGMLAGTSRTVRITEALPLEGFRDP